MFFWLAILAISAQNLAKAQKVVMCAQTTNQ